MNPRDGWRLNFDSAPFCNGSLHLGHVRCYVLGDIRARWLRSKGEAVRYATAYDAFGLPHQAGAAEAGQPTHEYVSDQIERIARQLRMLDLSYDLADHPRTCDPAYYRWTQWLFLRLLDAGLVYTADKSTPFCESCCEYLAATQIESGGCWRCGNPVSSRESEHWFIRTSHYTDRLSATIDYLDGWSDRARNLMRTFLGRMEGTEAALSVSGYELRFFRPNELESATIAVRADHALVEELRGHASDLSQRSRRPVERRGPVPIAVLAAGPRFQVVACPADDLPRGVDALLIRDIEEFPADMPRLSAELGPGEPGVRYRVHDWLVSRKRDWGTPIPIVDCSECGYAPVLESDLPVSLACHGGDGTALCSKCETRQPTVPRILDCFLDDAWCFWAAHPEWDPSVNPFELWRQSPPAEVFFHSGYDSFVYLYLYRFLGHALFDMDLLASPEVVDGFKGHDVVTADGRKMSKRHGNAPDLDALLEEHGVDVIRLATIAGANPGSPLSWSDDCLKRAHRLVHTFRRAVSHPASPARDAPGSGRVVYRLARADRFLAEYRVASAVQETYMATKDFLRLKAPSAKLKQSVLDAWSLFLPSAETSPQKPHLSMAQADG